MCQAVGRVFIDRFPLAGGLVAGAGGVEQYGRRLHSFGRNAQGVIRGGKGQQGMALTRRGQHSLSAQPCRQRATALMPEGRRFILHGGGRRIKHPG